jgi:WD40 repeat protein
VFGPATFAPDGRLLACYASDDRFALVDAATGAVIRTIHHGLDSPTGPVFSYDGTRLATGSGEGIIKIWDVVTGEELDVLRGHESEVFRPAFSPDGSLLASPSWDGTIRIWDVAPDRYRPVLKALPEPEPWRGRIYAVAFSPDSDLIVSRVDEVVTIWDARTGNRLATLDANPEIHVAKLGVVGPKPKLAVSRDGSRIASATTDGQTITIWNASTGRAVRTLPGHYFKVQCMDFSRDGTRLASGGMLDGVRIWDVTTGTEVQRLPTPSHGTWPATWQERWIDALTFSRDGTRLAVALREGTVRILDTETWHELAMLQGGANAVAFSPDGTKLASTSMDVVRIWDVSSREELKAVRGQGRSVSAFVAFSPDGTRLARRADFTVTLWDAASGDPVLTLTGHTAGIGSSLAFSPDGTRIAAGFGDATIRFWDTLTPQQRILERRAALRAAAEASLVVDRLFEQLAEADSVVEAIRNDDTFGDADRRAALNLVLKRLDTERISRLDAIDAALESEAWNEAERLIDQAIAADPGNIGLRERMLRMVLTRMAPERAYACADRLIDDLPDLPRVLENLAVYILDDPDVSVRNLRVARKAAARANELTDGQHADILETVARIHYELGDLQKAIELQRLAVAACKVPPFEWGQQRLTETLRQYEAEANEED